MHQTSEKLQPDVGSVTGFYLDHGYTKGRLVRLCSNFNELIQKNAYPPVVNKYIAEAALLLACLYADNKCEGTFTLQITTKPDSGGFIRLIVVDMNDKGHLRAYARWDEESLNNHLKTYLQQSTGGGEITLPHIFGQAHLVFTADLYNQVERYQAIVELTGKNLKESMHHFFRQSEQIPTMLTIYSDDPYVTPPAPNPTPNSANILTAGAVILQRLPTEKLFPLDNEAAQEEWITDICLLKTLTKDELLDSKLDSKALIYHLFHERSLNIIEQTPLKFSCPCSKERLDKVFNSFSKDEIRDMALDGSIKVDCEFCGTEYIFPLKE